MRRAAKEGWNIPDVAYDAVPKALLEIAFARDSSTPRPLLGEPDTRPYVHKTERRLEAMRQLRELNEQNLGGKFADPNAARDGGLTLPQIVRMVEEDRRCEVINAEWLEAHGLGVPKTIAAESQPEDEEEGELSA
jgi:hypothetical protein